MTLYQPQDDDDNEIVPVLIVMPEYLEATGTTSRQFNGKTIAVIPDFVYGDTYVPPTQVYYGFHTVGGGSPTLTCYFNIEGYTDLTLAYEVGDEISFFQEDTAEVDDGTPYFVKTVTSTTITISATEGGDEITFATAGNTLLCNDVWVVLNEDDIVRNTFGVAASLLQYSYEGELGYGHWELETYRYFPLDQEGVFVYYDRWAVDFAQDLSPPSPLASWYVNKQLFDWNSNDDKRKVATRVTVRGKDMLGQSISVSLSGIRKFDEDRKFFNGCTYVSKKSEGYIYKNSYATDLIKDCTFIPGSSVTYSVDFPSNDKTKITVGATGFTVNNMCSFTNPPTPLVDSQAYYIVYHTGDYIKVSSTLSGTPISCDTTTNDVALAISNSAAAVAGNLLVNIKGVLAKTVAVPGTGSAHDMAVLINNAFAGGYVDGDGVTWTTEVDSVYGRVTYNAVDEGLGNTVVEYDDNGTFITWAVYSFTLVPWVVTLEASDLGVVEVDNTDGWFTLGMSLTFSASELPAGISMDTIYTVGADPGLSSSAIFPLKESGVMVNFTTAGSNVKAFKPNSVKNLDENGNPCVWLYGWGYSIRDGDNVGVSIPEDSIDTMVVVGTPLEVIDLNGVMCTTVGVNEIPVLDYGGGRGFFLNEKIYMNNPYDYGYGTLTDFLIGEEFFGHSHSISIDEVWGLFVECPLAGRVTSSTNKCYPHGVGAIVMGYSDNPTYPYYYDVNFPEADSPVDLHGSKIADVTVDGNTTYGYLDAYATALLLGQGQLFKKATCWSTFNFVGIKRAGYGDTTEGEWTVEMDRLTLPRVGDLVQVYNNYADATGEPWQVMSVKITYDKGLVEMVLGDYEMNPITSMIKATNGINRPIT